jgi:hypothetical protein
VDDFTLGHLVDRRRGGLFLLLCCLHDALTPHLIVKLRQQLPLLFLVGLDGVVGAEQKQVPMRHGVNLLQRFVQFAG